MANLKTPTPKFPAQSDKIEGAAAGFLREIVAAKETGAIAIRVIGAAGKIPFRVQGNGTDGGAEDGDGWPADPGEPWPYSQDIGQQHRASPAITAWTVFVVCDEAAADIHVVSSLHRNGS